MLQEFVKGGRRIIEAERLCVDDVGIPEQMKNEVAFDILEIAMYFSCNLSHEILG